MNPSDSNPGQSRLTSWSKLPQFALHQAGWWACVIWMGWWGPAVMLGFLLLHLVILRDALRIELPLILLSTLLGIALDNSLALTESVDYTGRILVGQCPLWLVAIWAGFGATLRHCQQIFVRSMRHAALTGFLGGPLAYWGGVKLERLQIDGLAGFVAISVTWGVVMMSLYAAVSHLEKTRASDT